MKKSRYIVKTVAELETLTSDLKNIGYEVVSKARNLRELRKEDHQVTIIRDKNI